MSRALIRNVSPHPALDSSEAAPGKDKAAPMSIFEAADFRDATPRLSLESTPFRFYDSRIVIDIIIIHFYRPGEATKAHQTM